MPRDPWTLALAVWRRLHHPEWQGEHGGPTFSLDRRTGGWHAGVHVLAWGDVEGRYPGFTPEDAAWELARELGRLWASTVRTDKAAREFGCTLAVKQG